MEVANIICLVIKILIPDLFVSHGNGFPSNEQSASGKNI